MGNVACALRSIGHTVAGSDAGIYPPMSEVLESAEIELHSGFDAEALKQWEPDYVVVGNAVSRGNDQLEYLLETRAFPYISMPDAISRFLLKDRPRMVVAGTHGKTTTSSAAAYILSEQAEQPGYLIGGVPLDLPSGAASGSAESPFVIEGDEYDSAIFDKRSKFQHYFPNVLLVNNLEFDHGDIFTDDADYFRTFRHLVRLVPRNGCILLNADDPGCLPLMDHAYCEVLKVGFAEDADYRISNFEESDNGAAFEVTSPSEVSISVNSLLNADFNARNLVMAAVGAAHLVGEPDSWAEFLATASSFGGVRRRMDCRYDSSTCKVFEDFGHHPTAIEASLKSLKRRFPDAELWAAFEPRSNTTVTRRFQDRFKKAFSIADVLHVAPIFRPERLSDDQRLDSENLAQSCGVSSVAWKDWEELERYILNDFVPSSKSRVLVFFSNGAFNGLISIVTKALSY